MSTLKKILDELDELYIVNKICNQHFVTRGNYPNKEPKVKDDIEFDDMIADYYNYHYTTCISHGGELTRADAAGKAKEIIEREYKRKGKDRLHAYQDGIKGSHEGGMQAILTIILNYLMDEVVEHHIRDVIDRYVRVTSYEEQVKIVKEIIAHMTYVPSYIDPNHPERYAKNYEELIRGLSENINRNAARFRRL